jgi:TolB protein
MLLVGSFALLALLVALTAMPAGAERRDSNGRIAFARFDPALGDTVLYTVKADGSRERQVLPDALECPHWSPDGTRIATCGDASSGGASRIIDPRDGSYRVLPMFDPANMFLPCFIWSPDGGRLACEGFGLNDPSRNGIYSVRSTDGGGVVRITSNPGGDDIPGAYSPNGKRLVFARGDQSGTSGLFVVKVDGSGLRPITAPGALFSSFGDWSPEGNQIVFSQHVTVDKRSSIWIVRADGTGLHEVVVQGQPLCGGASAEPGTISCFSPSWSPDGERIVFSRGTSGDNDSNIYTVNVDGSGLTQVTHGGRDQSPDWGTRPDS